MTTPRTAQADALLTLVASITWGDPPRGFAYASRRFQPWDDCPSQPAIYLVQHNEHPTQATRMPTRNIREYQLVIYQDTAKNVDVPGSLENDLILDALEAALRPPPGYEVQTLGGLVAHAWIEGEIFSDSGDLDGQGVITVPIRVLVP